MRGDAVPPACHRRYQRPLASLGGAPYRTHGGPATATMMTTTTTTTPHQSPAPPNSRPAETLTRVISPDSSTPTSCISMAPCPLCSSRIPTRTSPWERHTLSLYHPRSRATDAPREHTGASSISASSRRVSRSPPCTQTGPSCSPSCWLDRRWLQPGSSASSPSSRRVLHVGSSLRSPGPTKPPGTSRKAGVRPGSEWRSSDRLLTP